MCEGRLLFGSEATVCERAKQGMNETTAWRIELQMEKYFLYVPDGDGEVRGELRNFDIFKPAMSAASKKQKRKQRDKAKRK